MWPKVPKARDEETQFQCLLQYSLKMHSWMRIFGSLQRYPVTLESYIPPVLLA